MRLRHIPEGKKILETHKKVITKPEEIGEKWAALFDNGNPIHVELGAGKGRFTMEMAKRNPDVNFLACEANTKVIYRWLKGMDEVTDPSNYYIVHSRGETLIQLFQPRTIQCIYLNFSDPWPKPRHERRRLTSPEHLALYKRVLTDQGRLIVKTDNVDLFNYSIEVLKENNWNIVQMTEDLHESKERTDDVATEYEMKFVAEGKKILRVVASCS